MKKEVVFKYIAAIGFLVAFSLMGFSATTLEWNSLDGGDLMDKKNWKQGQVPQEGDTLSIDRKDFASPISGEFTFFHDDDSHNETPNFDTINFARPINATQSLNPGNGKILRSNNLNIRYNNNMSILSGSYYLSQLGVGNSTSSSDLTYLIVNGEGTYVNADLITVGIGSDKVNQSRGNVTISGRAIVDSQITLGAAGGKENVFTISGEGTRVYSTNKAVIVGTEKKQRLKLVKDENGNTVKDENGKDLYEVFEGAFWYSRNNVVTLSEKAVMVATNAYLSSENSYDISSTGNVLKVTSGALADIIDTVYIKGSNSVFVSDLGQINAKRIYVGRWTSLPASAGSYLEVANSGKLLLSEYLYVGGEYSYDNVLSLNDNAVVEVPEFYIVGQNSAFLSDGAKMITTNTTIGYWSLANYSGGSSYCEVGNNSSIDAKVRILVGANKGKSISIGSELKVLSGGKLTTPLLEVGQLGGVIKDNKLTVEAGASVQTSMLHVYSTNIVEICGTMTVTNKSSAANGIGEFGIGRVNAYTGDPSASKFIVNGGDVYVGYDDEVFINRPTFYIGHYQKQSNDNLVEVKNGGKVNLIANHVHVGAAGCGNSLVVTGEGSRFVHDALNSARDIIIGVSGREGIDNGRNSVVVANGGYLETDAGIQVGNKNSNPSYDNTLKVEKGVVKIAQALSVGINENMTNSQLIVKGTTSRVTAKKLEVGPRSRIVFDISDSLSTSDAMVKLSDSVTFSEGSRIYITSSDPLTTKAPAFECTLLSCEKNMDLSNVVIEIDPACEFRIRSAGNGKTLKVAGGKRPGMSIRVR